MKGKTRCPNCNHTFIVDVTKEQDKHRIECPNCKTNFMIKTSSTKKTKKKCHWEEHGEPRKTILSSMKPKTNKPNIAAILLVCIFAIGITTAAFSGIFINTTSDLGNAAGLKGTVEIDIIQPNNQTEKNITVTLDNQQKTGNSKIIFKNTELGIKSLTISEMGKQTYTKEILVSPFTTTKEEIDANQTKSENEEFGTTGCSIIIGIFSIFSLVAAIACIKRNHFDIAIAGTVIAILSVGFYFTGAILSIISLVLIMFSRDEFENGKKGKIF
ncbi:MAG: hypothetical protein V5A64_06630 [Candidatus Thermoplasmatota archaeon]